MNDDPTTRRADAGRRVATSRARASPPAPSPPPGQYPGYGPPYDRPPPGQNPYGGDTTSYYQPIDSGGMSSTVKVVLGVVIGVFAGFFLWVFAAILFSLGVSDTGTEFLFFAAVAPWSCRRPC